jgi:hypothetical protein
VVHALGNFSTWLVTSSGENPDQFTSLITGRRNGVSRSECSFFRGLWPLPLEPFGSLDLSHYLGRNRLRRSAFGTDCFDQLSSDRLKRSGQRGYGANRCLGRIGWQRHAVVDEQLRCSRRTDDLISCRTRQTERFAAETLKGVVGLPIQSAIAQLKQSRSDGQKLRQPAFDGANQLPEPDTFLHRQRCGNGFGNVGLFD